MTSCSHRLPETPLQQLAQRGGEPSSGTETAWNDSEKKEVAFQPDQFTTQLHTHTLFASVKGQHRRENLQGEWELHKALLPFKTMSV